MPLRGGETFAGYRIVRLLGSGGMGEVYLAEHPRLPRRDALKILPVEVSADPDYRARFNREADLASNLSHSHIVSVHDRGEYNGQLWISMDYVEGLDAGRLLADRFPAGMPVDQVVRILSAVGSALDYAHKRGLLHRDVKPANIMLSHGDNDDEERILLADFGIARDVDDISGLTATNITLGTVYYSAPEQLKGENIDGRADQYALAATAYHLLTGSPLFPHPNPAVVITRQLSSPPPALADTRPELSALDPVLAKALAKHPADRFTLCADFARALAEEAGPEATISGAPTRPAAASRKPVGQSPHQTTARGSRRWWLLAAATVAIILLVSAIALAWRPWQRGKTIATTTASAQRPVISSTPSAQPLPPPAPPPPTLPANAIDTVLLGPAEIAGVTGSTGPPLEISRNSDYPIWSRLEPASCSNVMFNAEHVTDPNTGVVAERDGKFARSSLSEGKGPANVEESVLIFASVDEAEAVFNSSQAQWRSCASNKVTVGYGEDSWTYNFGDVQFHGDVSSVSMAAGSTAEVGGRACQTAIGLRANVVVETWTCLWANFPYFPATPADPNEAGDYAVQLVTAMLGKVKV